MTGRPPADPPTAPPRSSNGGSAPLDAAAVVVSNVIGGGILLMPAIVARMAPEPLGVDVGVAGRRRARVRRRDGLRRAGGDAAARRRRVRLPARRLRPAGRVPHRVDVVRRRLLRRHRRRRRRPRRLPRRFVPVAGDQTPWFSLPLGVAVADALAAEPGGDDDHRRLQRACTPSASGPGRSSRTRSRRSRSRARWRSRSPGSTWGQAPPGHRGQPAATGDGVTVGGWLLALVPVMFSYSGWNAAAYVAEEIRDPSRRLPRALALGTAIVVVVYLAMNAFYLYALPMAIAEGARAARHRRRRRAAVRGAAAGALTGLSVLITAGKHQRDGVRRAARLLRDGARRPVPAGGGARPSALADAGRRRSPRRACGAPCSCCRGRSRSWSATPASPSCCSPASPWPALFVLRWREPDAPRPFRAWGYPLAPALFTAMSAAMVVNAVWRDPGPVRRRPGRDRLRRADLLPAPRSIGGVLTAGGRGSAVPTAPARDCDGSRLWIQCGRPPLWPPSPPPRAARPFP